MDAEDVRIMREVEAIFVRNYVDTARLSIDVINRSVYIDGYLHVHDYQFQHRQQATEENEAMELAKSQNSTKKLLMLIEQQIRGTREVGSLHMKFTNWRKGPTGWQEAESA